MPIKAFESSSSEASSIKMELIGIWVILLNHWFLNYFILKKTPLPNLYQAGKSLKLKLEYENLKNLYK